MSTKHTPGEWFARDIANCGWVDIDSDNREGNPIGYVTPKRNGTPKERGDAETIANAALIAAAPKLLDSVEELLVEIERAMPHVTDVMQKIPADTIARARAAIQKATGEGA